MFNHHAADRIKIFVRNVGVEGGIKVFNEGGGFNPVAACGGQSDVVAIAVEVVMFILDFAHDFFQDVFDRDQSCDSAVFIHNNGHVVTVCSKFT